AARDLRRQIEIRERPRGRTATGIARSLRGGTQRRRTRRRHQRQGAVDGRNAGGREDLRHDPRRLRQQRHLRRRGRGRRASGRRGTPAGTLRRRPPHRIRWLRVGL
ncbi:MAG: Leucyl aminopeptidase, partial [uncultured Rubrobacteraceae bacterium]